MERSRGTSIGPKMMPPLRGFFLNPQRLIMAPLRHADRCRRCLFFADRCRRCLFLGEDRSAPARGQSGALLTLIGHSAAWTYAAKALTFWLRVKRREFIRLIG